MDTVADAVGELLEVEVVYVGREGADRTVIRLAPGSTLADAVRASGVLTRNPALVPASGSIGVFGRLRDPDEAISGGDRIELYRPLDADPKLVRRQRVRNARLGR